LPLGPSERREMSCLGASQKSHKPPPRCRRPKQRKIEIACEQSRAAGYKHRTAAVTAKVRCAPRAPQKTSTRRVRSRPTQKTFTREKQAKSQQSQPIHTNLFWHACHNHLPVRVPTHPLTPGRRARLFLSPKRVSTWKTYEFCLTNVSADTGTNKNHFLRTKTHRPLKRKFQVEKDL
jgi:hypothetical protein